MRDQIIDYIKTNRVSTTEAADCMGKSGLFAFAYSLNRGRFRVGKVKWLYAYNESNWSIHEHLDEVQEGDIVMIEAFHCKDRAVIGELISKYLLLYRKAAAIISNAKFRDGARLIKENYPIWCAGLTPIGCFNTQNQAPLEPGLYQKHHNAYEGSIAVCDDSGVVIIPEELHTKEFYEKLIAIEEQEDIWFDCLDRRKWSPYEIVCLKKYRKQPEDGKGESERK